MTPEDSLSGDGQETPKPPDGGAPAKRRGLDHAWLGLAISLLTLFATVGLLFHTRGQYYQSGYSTRIGITTLWKNGYAADTRNRVTRFNSHYDHLMETDSASAREMVHILATRDLVLSADSIRGNRRGLMVLLAADLEAQWRELQDKEKTRKLPDEVKWQELSDHDVVEAALKYRNAIIECLNTMEAIKAVMHERPWESGLFGSRDLLEVRYEALIQDLTCKLRTFVDEYRGDNKQRSKMPWEILDDPKNKCPAQPAH